MSASARHRTRRSPRRSASSTAAARSASACSSVPLEIRALARASSASATRIGRHRGADPPRGRSRSSRPGAGRRRRAPGQMPSVAERSSRRSGRAPGTPGRRCPEAPRSLPHASPWRGEPRPWGCSRAREDRRVLQGEVDRTVRKLERSTQVAEVHERPGEICPGKDAGDHEPPRSPSSSVRWISSIAGPMSPWSSLQRYTVIDAAACPQALSIDSRSPGHVGPPPSPRRGPRRAGGSSRRSCGSRRASVGCRVPPQVSRLLEPKFRDLEVAGRHVGG